MSAQGIKGLYQKRGWYYFQPPKPTDGGPRPAAMALKTKDLMTALDTMRVREVLVSATVVPHGTRMDEVLPSYHAFRYDDEKSTRIARKVVLDGFSEACGNPRMADIDLAMIQGWRKTLAEKGGKRGRPVSGATLRSYTITLRAFLNWAHGQKMISAHPLAKVERRMLMPTSRVQEFLTEDEREKLLAAAADAQLKLILHLGFFAGLRDGEMLALHPGWLWISPDGMRGTLTVQSTPITFTDGMKGMWRPKSKKNRKIPLHPRLVACLLEYGMREPWMIAPDKALWPEEKKRSKRYDAKKALAGVAKRAGVGKLTPHMLRHSFATHLAMKGVALAEIAAMLGDSISVTEQHYAGFCPNKVNPLEVL